MIGKDNIVELGNGSPINIVVVGSLAESRETNEKALGIYTAQLLVARINEARQKGSHLALDMPTGSSPKPTWSALREMASRDEVDLSNIIFFGHEAEWPPAIGNPSLDYENQRRQILKSLGIEPYEIMHVDQITSKVIKGNFIPMYQLPPDGDDVLAIATRSADIYDEEIKCLLDRPDVDSWGMYGVGPDGHGGGELQLFHLWPCKWETTGNTFLMGLGNYNYKNLWRLLTDNGSFDKGENTLWYRHQEFPKVQLLMGLGRNAMGRLDDSVHIFNSPSKYAAFINTMNGLGGILKISGREVVGLKIFNSRGEELLSEFMNLAEDLYRRGRIGSDSFRQAKTCQQVVAVILEPYEDKIPPEEITSPLWILFTKYFGYETPVCRLVKERTSMGKPSTLVLPADVVRNTQFEYLAER